MRVEVIYDPFFKDGTSTHRLGDRLSVSDDKGREWVDAGFAIDLSGEYEPSNNGSADNGELSINGAAQRQTSEEV